MVRKTKRSTRRRKYKGGVTQAETPDALRIRQIELIMDGFGCGQYSFDNARRCVNTIEKWIEDRKDDPNVPKQQLNNAEYLKVYLMNLMMAEGGSRKKKTRNQSKRNHKRKSIKGGAYVPSGLPPEAVVVWRNLQEDEDASPIVTSYKQTRNNLELDN
jgi:hypothetical protein